MTIKPDSSIVSVVRAKNGIPEGVARSFELAGPPALHAGDSIAIKLNLCLFRPYETGATADPRVVEATILYLRALADDLDIALVESDATSARCDLLFRWLGFTELSSKLGVRTVNLSNDKRIKVPLPSSCYLKQLYMPKTLLDADYILSLAKLKTHGLTKITCSHKNHFGSIPYRGKIKWHPVLSKVIADANVAVKTNFSLVDGVIAMEGVDGPTMGVPKMMDLLIAGRDPVAVDSVCAKVMGFDPDSIGHIVEAEKRGVGSRNYRAVGEDISQVMEKFDYSGFYHVLEQAIRKVRGRV